MAATKLKTQPCNSCSGTGRVPDWETGPVLRAERDKAGVLQKDVATHMGISETYVYDLESGRRPWTNELVAAYQKAVLDLQGS